MRDRLSIDRLVWSCNLILTETENNLDKLKIVQEKYMSASQISAFNKKMNSDFEKGAGFTLKELF